MERALETEGTSAVRRQGNLGARLWNAAHRMCRRRTPDATKPLAVRLVELQAWVYVVFAAAYALYLMYLEAKGNCAAISHLSRYCGRSACQIAAGLILIPPYMLHRLRKGCFEWFLLLNFLMMLFVSVSLMDAASAQSLSALQMPIPGLVAAAIAIVAPVVLLALPSSRQWSKAVAPEGYSPVNAVVAVFAILILTGVWTGVFLVPCSGSRIGAKASAAAACMRNIGLAMSANEESRAAGGCWVDPSACSNSTQFVAALLGEGDSGESSRYASGVCIAVNPPDDGSFPVVVSANVDPRELLFPKDKMQVPKRTCLEELGGKCLGFCRGAVVVAHGNGAVQTYKGRYAAPHCMFDEGPIPSPAPETYYLTPTGRVYFAERTR